jgi:hypothetical protein
MARIRSIHPDSCVSATLAKLSASQERTFWRLLTHCDDQGRARADWRLIKSSIYPLHDDMTPRKVGDDVAELATLGLVEIYSADGKDYLQVSSWHEYQHPKRAMPSKLPPLPPKEGEELTHKFPTCSPLVPPNVGTSSPKCGNTFPTCSPLEKEKEREREIGEGGEEREGNPVPHPSPAACNLTPWLQDELRNIGITDAQSRTLAKDVGPRLPAALFKLRAKSPSNPAGLLVGKAAELAQEGEAMLREQVDRWKVLAPKEALSGAQWGALPEYLRQDLEVQARWLAWMATKARLEASSEHGRFEAIGELSVAQRLALEILEDRHPERDRIRAEVQQALPASKSETARRGALMRALGLEPSVPVDLQVMPLAVGAR